MPLIVMLRRQKNCEGVEGFTLAYKCSVSSDDGDLVFISRSETYRETLCSFIIIYKYQFSLGIPQFDETTKI